MKKVIAVVGPIAAGIETVGLYLNDRLGIKTYKDSNEIVDNGILLDIRRPQQLQKLSKEADLTIIAIDAQADKRYERHYLDCPHEQPVSLQEFVDQELMANIPPQADRLFECMQLATYTVENNGTLAELYPKLDEIIIQAGLKS